MADRLKRAQVPEQETWNLSDLFANDDAWEEELRAIRESFDAVAQYKGHLADGARVVLQCLDARETLATRFTRVSTYASLKFSEDGSNPLNQTNSDRVAALGGELNAATSFVDSELLELPAGTIEGYLASLTGLEEHRNGLEQLAEYKPYRLSTQTEAALAALGPVHAAPYAIYQRSKSSDMQFESVVDDDGNEHAMSAALYEDKFEQSSDTNLRRAAFRSFAKTFGQYQNTIAAAYSAEVKKQVTLARLRGYASVTDMLLQPQQVPVELYNNILDVIQRNLAPHMRRLARLRKRVLGLDKMLHCDLKAPLDPAFQPKTTFEQASDTILGALSVLGDEYTGIIRKGLTHRWVDLADNVGKSTGAFCSSPYGVHPYILITWTDNMRSTFVLAHELGHAGHFSLAQRNQRYVNTRPSMTFVEAPSTMNEMLLGQYILKRSEDEKMRRWVIMQLLGTYYHNYVTHLLEGEFQRRVYKLADAGTPMTATLLSQLKGDVLSEFWGDAVEIEDAAKLMWMRQPHYYMGLYPYTYSVGLTVSTLTAQRIFTEGQPAVDDWIRVLQAGGTKKPLELMQMAGVDMSTPEPIERAVAYVGTLVDELEKNFS